MHMSVVLIHRHGSPGIAPSQRYIWSHKQAWARDGGSAAAAAAGDPWSGGVEGEGTLKDRHDPRNSRDLQTTGESDSVELELGYRGCWYHTFLSFELLRVYSMCIVQ